MCFIFLFVYIYIYMFLFLFLLFLLILFLFINYFILVFEKKNSLLHRENFANLAKFSQCVIFAMIANFCYDSEIFRYGPHF